MKKNALITGSTSGIGLAIAKSLAQQGHNIILNGLGDLNEIEALRKSMENTYGVTVIFIEANLMKLEAIEQLVATAQQQLGTIDILVNNAGMQHISPIENFDPEKWNAIIALNLTAAFHLSRLVIPAMKQKQWGRIINIASAHGLVASPLKSAYVASKHGIVGLTKVIALETANDGITCNAVCPGYVLTPLVEKQIPEIAKEREMTEDEVIQNVLLYAQAKKSFVEVDEIAATVLFLCQDTMQSLTGVALPVDGGWTAH